MDNDIDSVFWDYDPYLWRIVEEDIKLDSDLKRVERYNYLWAQTKKLFLRLRVPINGHTAQERWAAVGLMLADIQPEFNNNIDEQKTLSKSAGRPLGSVSPFENRKPVMAARYVDEIKRRFLERRNQVVTDEYVVKQAINWKDRIADKGDKRAQNAFKDNLSISQYVTRVRDGRRLIKTNQTRI